MLHRYLLPISGLLGICGIGLGAFGAHGLHDRLAAANMVSTWETAVLYHLVHTLALLAVALWATGDEPRTRWLGRAAGCWVIGVVLFSGSLYSLALGGPRWLGPVTPLGGLAFIVGWAMLFPAGGKAGR
jgi:uncharacterized membrane protein YgdD (TMEM256/DUF423 family)